MFFTFTRGCWSAWCLILFGFAFNIFRRINISIFTYSFFRRVVVFARVDLCPVVGTGIPVSMSGCKICSSRLSSKSPGLQCGGCHGNFHAKCVKISSDALEQIKAGGVFWKCSKCRGNLDKSVIIDDEISDSQSSSGPSNAQLYRLLSSIQNDVKNLSNKYDEIVKSISFYGDKITDFERALNNFGDKIKQVDALVAVNSKLKADLAAAECRLDHLEQYSRLNNLIIAGVPEHVGENLPEIVSNIAEAIKSPIVASDIDAVHRLPQRPSPGKDKSRAKAIIVKFTSRITRDRIFSAAKLYRRSANGRCLSIPDVADNLYINEHLTARNMDLFSKVREIARNKNYKYIWTKSCVIHVRKDDRAKILVIKSSSDLNKL